MKSNNLQERPEQIGGYIVEHQFSPKKEIYRARMQGTLEDVVIKKSTPHNKRDGSCPAEAGEQLLMYEAELQKRCEHPNVVPVRELLIHDNKLYLVMPYCGVAMDYKSFATEKEKLSTLEDIAKALAHCHTQGIAHMDVKAGNIIINGKAHLADFDAAREIGVPHPHYADDMIVGTAYALAPEYLRTGQFSAKSDSFQFSLLAYRTLMKKEPFATYEDEKDTFIEYKTPIINPYELAKYGKLGLKILQGLAIDPDKRPTMEEFLEAFKQHNSNKHHQHDARLSAHDPASARSGRHPKIKPEQHTTACYTAGQQQPQAHPSV